ncbi:helix-turn-helix domain-containing protein [Paraburkholderia phenoliruptrix]|uniref:helix-turn-helix domain-containing protein n=1 Tax=Paraburkholderia phenoliruptrix TaxID=252970 RepID=UPI003D959110
MVEDRKNAKHLGRALAAARTNAHLTQEQVAEHLGVFVETVSRFERGANWPTVPRLIALAELYQIPVSTLLGRSSDRAVDVSADITAQLERLSNDDRNWVSNLVRDLCSRLPGSDEKKKGHR